MNTPGKKENKLKLQKATIVMLNENQMKQIRGGNPAFAPVTADGNTSTLPICDTFTLQNTL